MSSVSRRPTASAARRESTYPGIGCDVPSHVYSYSFAPNPDFTRMFSPGHEIQAYLEQVAVDHGVVPHLRLGDEVVAATTTTGVCGTLRPRADIEQTSTW